MNFIKDYLVSPTHKWWVDNVWRPSWTRLTSLVYGIPALVVTAFEQINKYAQDSTISEYIGQLGVPNWVPMAFAGIALVHYIAHGRD